MSLGRQRAHLVGTADAGADQGKHLSVSRDQILKCIREHGWVYETKGKTRRALSEDWSPLARERAGEKDVLRGGHSHDPHAGRSHA